MADCLLGLGSNVGDRAAQLDRAVQLICAHPQVTAHTVSRYYHTAPVGGPPGQDAFVNAALRVQTSLTPQQLLSWTRQVERQLGRERSVRWGPRGIDVDLLLYDRLVLQTADLTIPHPRMGMRRFVLTGAGEIAADMVHPRTGWTLARLLSRLDERPCYVAVCSAVAARSRQLVTRAASLARAQLVLSPEPLPLRDGSSQRPADPGKFLDAFGQSLRCYSETLAATLARVATDALVLSDYWMHQFLALARASLAADSPELVRANQLVQLQLQTVPLPHFTLHLDVADGQAGSWAAEYAQQLRQQTLAPNQGPLLTVEDEREDWIELQAGVDAMR